MSIPLKNYDEIGRMLDLMHGDNNLTFYYVSGPVHAPDALLHEVVLPDDANKFEVKDGSGTVVSWFGDGGNLVLNGDLSTGSGCTAPSNSFIIKDSSGGVTAYFDPNGDLCIEGTKSEQQASCSSPDDSFIIKNVTGTEVIVINSTNGDLCLTGSLYENSNP
jgi:hypothetical protein